MCVTLQYSALLVGHIQSLEWLLRGVSIPDEYRGLAALTLLESLAQFGLRNETSHWHSTVYGHWSMW